MRGRQRLVKLQDTVTMETKQSTQLLEERKQENEPNLQDPSSERAKPSGPLSACAQTGVVPLNKVYLSSSVDISVKLGLVP